MFLNFYGKIFIYYIQDTMKKILLSINRYFSNFLIYLTIVFSFIIYVMYKVPVFFWIGNRSVSNYIDNAAGLFVKFLEREYLMFFFFPFLPILIGFFVIALFVWIFYRKEKEISRQGFSGIIIGFLAGFVLFYMPIKANNLSYKIDQEREAEIRENYNSDLKKVTIYTNKEFYKLYQTLADDGLQEWRKDPIEVVRYELEKGSLTSLSREDDILMLKTIDGKKEKGRTARATVELKNEARDIEIYLNSFWESDDGIWTVYAYKKME